MAIVKLIVALILGIALGIPGMVIGTVFIVLTMLRPAVERLMSIVILLGPAAFAAWVTYGIRMQKWPTWMAVAAAAILMLQGIVLEIVVRSRQTDERA